VAPIWEEEKIEAMTHLEDTLRIMGEEATWDFHRRWQYLLNDLQMREPHSLTTPQLAFFKISWYKETTRRLKVKWIELKVNPSLLLQPSPPTNLNKDKEKKE
jgi:hypothetical protein